MIEELPRFLTSDGREFRDRGAAEEHEGFLSLVAACKRVWFNESAAIAHAELLASAKREDLKNLIGALEEFA